MGQPAPPPTGREASSSRAAPTRPLLDTSTAGEQGDQRLAVATHHQRGDRRPRRAAACVRQWIAANVGATQAVTVRWSASARLDGCEVPEEPRHPESARPLVAGAGRPLRTRMCAAPRRERGPWPRRQRAW